MEELKLYHMVTSDLATLKGQQEEFYVVKLLFGLAFKYFHVRQAIMVGDQIPLIRFVYSQAMHASSHSITSPLRCLMMLLP